MKKSPAQPDPCNDNGSPDVPRRRFLCFGMATLAAACLPHGRLVAEASDAASDRSLAFYNTHTGERLATTYWEHGRYVGEALSQIDHILRDHLANEVQQIEPRLLDLLHAMQNQLDSREPFHVISGYRSANTNAYLRARSSDVADNSLHTVGKAIDIRLPGRDLRLLRKVAVELKGGGVGFYPKSDFVHVDVGRVRYW